MKENEIFEILGIDKDKPVNIISRRDFEGDNRLTIVIQSNGAVDSIEQTVSSARLLIDTIFNKTSKEDDDTVQLKAVISLLDHIGACIRSNLPYKFNGMNIEMVKEYIDWFMRDNLHNSMEFNNILDRKSET
ncbi:hypothetical protein [Paenibacillus piscarius]|uniref:hypothetical protein n=1 Tax=Paenibacillus piscarius TaxID=1089681 RepID=UPI001EE96476|nr:hypothetical protein [Paenibacillus piscarius]